MTAATLGVHVDGVSKRFTHRVKGEIYAARDVRIDVAPGEFLTLARARGGGKTTMLRMIAGLEVPTAGDIFIRGLRVNDLSVQERNIGFVFQNYALFKNMNVFKNIAFGLKIRSGRAPTSKRAWPSC